MASCTVVVADFGDCANLDTIATLAGEQHCSVLVYAKNRDKKCDSYGKWETVAKPNLGREQGTYADYVVEHYDNLPEKIIFTPGSLQKHDRLNRFKTLLASPDATCANTSTHPRTSTILDEERDFRIHYCNGNLTSNTVGTLSQWYNRFVGDFESDRTHQTCFNGMLATTRENIHSHPVQYYQDLADQVNVSSNSEVGHFMERSMGPIFAADLPCAYRGILTSGP
jgi:hypothetical protein